MGRRYYLPDAPREGLLGIFDRLLRKPLPDTPDTVLIETQAGCNARCVFCPIGDDDIRQKLPLGRMSTELFQKILGELEREPPKHVIPCFANEPFLDVRLVDWLIEMHERLPTTTVTVVTNGSLLTEAVSRRLLEARVPDVLNISFHGVDRASYEASMGPLDFVETRERILRLLELKREMKVETPEVRVSMVSTKLVEDGVDEARRFWSRLGVELDVDPVENRGGSVSLDALAAASVPFTHCRRPFNTLVIAFDGQVPLCCVDFERKVVVGDVGEQSIRDIWKSGPLTRIRRGFLEPERYEGLPVTCRGCRLAE